MYKTYLKYSPFFLVFTLIAFTVAFIIPFVMGIGYSFASWSGSITNARFVGFSNYIEAFTDRRFINAFLFTARFTILSIITINIFAFTIAILLTRGKKFTNVFRTIFFMPNLIGGVVLGYIWQVIINSILYQFDVSLSYSGTYGFFGLLIVMNWQLIGYMTIIYIAAIQNINQELIDASKMDGANFKNILFRIIIPSVMPAITICLFLTLTNSFKLYDQNMALTSGGPNYQTQMLALEIVDTIYSRNLPGLGQAKAVIFFLLIGALALLQVYFTRRKEVEA